MAARMLGRISSQVSRLHIRSEQPKGGSLTAAVLP